MPIDQLIPEVLSDEKLQNVTGQIVTGQTVLVAYALGLFKELLHHSKTIQELSESLSLSERAIQALVACAATMGFVEYQDGFYNLSPLGEQCFDKNSPTYYGAAFDLLIQHNELMNYDAIRDAILTSAPQADKGKDIFSGDDSVGSTRAFVDEIHQKASAPAYFWTKNLDLSSAKKFIDIAGGSGMHTIAACLKNPDLSGVICDRKQVLNYSAEYINNFDLQDRIQLQEIDLWTSNYPKGAIMFLSDIFHDWNKEQCIILAKKCYDSLEVNGKIILHEMLFNDEKTGPALTAAYNMKMLLWTQGQQYSFNELKEILESVGFQNVNRTESLGNWSLIIGEKL